MLELRNICYEVGNDQESKEILKDVSLTIDEHFVAITGPNGSGKSTLAKMIAGIIQLTSGQILLDGEDITNLNITEMFLFSLFFLLTTLGFKYSLYGLQVTNKCF